MKKFLTLALVLLMTLSMISAASAEEQITLTVASFYNTGSASGWDGLVAKFQETYPNVNVEVQETSGQTEYLTKLTAQLASGTSPDIIAVENNHIAKFVESNLLLPLNDMIEADADFSIDEYYPHLVERYTFDGQIYGIPYDAQPSGMFFYNKGLFDEAGIAYPDETWTWDDMLDAAITLTKKDESGRITQYGVLANIWMNYVYSNGGSIMDDINNPTTCVLNSAESIEAVQFMVDLMQKYEVMPTPETLNTTGISGADMFATNQLAMYLDGFWAIVDLPDRWADIDVGLTMFPMSNNGGRAVTTGGTAYCVANGSKHPELAFEFVKYFMGPEGWEAASAAAVRGLIYPPAHIPSYEKLVVQNPQMTIENVDLNGKLVECSVFSPRIALWTEIDSKILTPVMEEIQLGYVSVEDGLNDITTRINDALESGEVW